MKLEMFNGIYFGIGLADMDQGLWPEVFYKQVHKLTNIISNLASLNKHYLALCQNKFDLDQQLGEFEFLMP